MNWLGSRASSATDEAQEWFNQAEDGMRAIGSGISSAASSVGDAADSFGDAYEDMVLWSWCDDQEEYERNKQGA